MILDEQLADTLLNLLSDGIYFVDRQRTITYWNHGAENLTGYTAEEVLGKRCWHNVLRHVDGEGHQLCRGWCPIIGTMMDGRGRKADVYLHHKDGHRVPVRVQTIARRDAEGTIIGAAEVFNYRTIQDMATIIDRLQQQAMLDHLTQLGNRRYIENNLATYLEELRRYESHFGVLLLDLDAFKKVNDDFGHLVGDKVLQMVANTLSHCLRTSDLVGRWGGDEFLIIVPYVKNGTLEATAERIDTLISQSFLKVEKRFVHVTASIGYAVAEAGDTIESLIQRADEHLYHGKQGVRADEPVAVSCGEGDCSGIGCGCGKAEG